MKLFLTGPLNSGKTTVIQRCLEGYSGPVWGFFSGRCPKDGPSAEIVLWEAAHPENRHVVAKVSPAGRQVFPGVFDSAGVAILQKVQPGVPGVVVMDEIGFMEAESPAFQREILRILDMPDIPVLGVLRVLDNPPDFLQRLHQREDLTLLAVTETERDALPACCRKLLGLPAY